MGYYFTCKYKNWYVFLSKLLIFPTEILSLVENVQSLTKVYYFQCSKSIAACVLNSSQFNQTNGATVSRIAITSTNGPLRSAAAVVGRELVMG